jgi:hypothetical protein
MMVADRVQSRKSKAVCVQAMKAYKGSGSIAPLILNLSTRWRYQNHGSAAINPMKEPTATSEWEAA